MNENTALKWLFDNYKIHKYRLYLIIILDLINIILLIIKINILSQIIYYSLINKILFKFYIYKIIKLFLINILQYLLNLISIKLKYIFSDIIKNKIKFNIINNLENYTFYYNNNTKIIDLTILIYEQINNIKDFYFKYIFQYYLSILIPLIISINILFYNLISFIILLIIFPIIILFIYIIGSSILEKNKNYSYFTRKLSKYFLNIYYGVETFKIFYSYNLESKKLYKIYEKLRIKTIDILKVSFLISVVVEIFSYVTTSSILTYNIFIYLKNFYLNINNNLINIEIIIKIFLILPEFFYPIINLGKLYHIKIKSINSALIIINFLNKINFKFIKEKINIYKDIYLIKAKNLIIKNNLNEIIIGPISFKIKKNDKIIIFGRSGEGKTTLIKTLLGFYNYNGSLKFNNIELRNLNIKSVRKKISWINDELNFSYETFIKNITYNYDNKRLVNLINNINIKKLYNFLKNNLNRYIGENSKLLSVGESQILSLFRFFSKNNSNFLFLDEPTINLDINNIILINKKIISLSNKNTIILSTNKYINNKNFNKIWILKNKKITFFK